MAAPPTGTNNDANTRDQPVTTVTILGMHRSGTSMVTRVLNLAGMRLGATDQLMGPKDDNPHGFWENRPIMQLQRDLLSLLGGSWHEPPPLLPGWEREQALDEMRDRARSVLVEAFGYPEPQDIVGWKDPRTSLLLPFWRTVTVIDRVVLVVRDPVAVALSLQERNGFGLEHGARLWLRYHLSALADAPEALVVDYDQALEDVGSTVSSLVDHVGLPRPDRDVWAQLHEFLDPAANHQSAKRVESPGPALRLASDLHRGAPGALDAAPMLLAGIQADELLEAVGPAPALGGGAAGDARRGPPQAGAPTPSPPLHVNAVDHEALARDVGGSPADDEEKPPDASKPTTSRGAVRHWLKRQPRRRIVLGLGAATLGLVVLLSPLLLPPELAIIGVGLSMLTATGLAGILLHRDIMSLTPYLRRAGEVRTVTRKTRNDISRLDRRIRRLERALDQDQEEIVRYLDATRLRLERLLIDADTRTHPTPGARGAHHDTEPDVGKRRHRL